MTDAPIADEPFDTSVTDSSVVYEGAVWDIRRDTVDYNGHEMVREYVDHTGAVAIYAEDDEGRVLVIQQYRHPVRLRDWELPAGLLDVQGEDPLEAAKRELAEEADLEADDWTELVRFNSSPGGSDERLIVYRARGVRATAEAFDRTDEEADIVKRWVPRAEVVAGALDGRLTNAALLLAALAVDAAERR
ncbi:NUDIX domain-containing protein [Curtobacterium sp. Leaf261]|uniref:NUDIX domain-containing protein n=1 Tax=Curtobacterium sp. Leaf261 TaxID=1736311 RepID=UPI0006F7E73B|nr:NUDIX hydrolase [Curtobacterium sp. Leaf261]KQO65222.1 ADP-ribose pyrophosphatase [Curtobacterium sp. Leaf261]